MNKDLILREKLAIQRTHLANQSTFLAFLRTAMYFFIAGLTIPDLSNHKFANEAEIVLFIVSSLVLVAGIFNYFINRNKIIQSEKHIGNYKIDYEQN